MNTFTISIYVICFAFYFSNVAFGYAVQKEACDPKQCVPINKCAYAQNQVEQEALTSDDVKQLLQHTCHSEEGVLKICCPITVNRSEDDQTNIQNIVKEIQENLNSSIDCNVDAFHCTDGSCIPWHLTCDGVQHCKDNSDEVADYCKPSACHSPSFRCLNRRCILPNQLCNGINNCGDSSDEGSVCNTCGENRFHCSSGGCILLQFRCDYDPDCEDASDEMNCEPRNCSKHHGDDNYLNCSNTTACIHKDWFCDGEDDCWDLSDEKDCDKIVY